MTLTIELEPEVERQLEIKAAKTGISVERWVSQTLKAIASTSPILNRPMTSTLSFIVSKQMQKYRTEDVAARLQAWDEFAENAQEFSKGATLLSDYGVSREGIYEHEVERNSR